MDNLEELHAKYFSIINDSNINIVIYQINRNIYEKDTYTIKRIDSTVEYLGDKTKQTFFVDNILPEGNDLIILSISPNKIIINKAILDYYQIKVLKKTFKLNTKILYSEETIEYNDFIYTPNIERNLAIIDLKTGEELKPVLYYDEDDNKVKGKYKLQAYEKYFLFEV